MVNELFHSFHNYVHNNLYSFVGWKIALYFRVAFMFSRILELCLNLDHLMRMKKYCIIFFYYMQWKYIGIYILIYSSLSIDMLIIRFLIVKFFLHFISNIKQKSMIYNLKKNAISLTQVLMKISILFTSMYFLPFSIWSLPFKL